jgi:hypothetical protein
MACFRLQQEGSLNASIRLTLGDLHALAGSRVLTGPEHTDLLGLVFDLGEEPRPAYDSDAESGSKEERGWMSTSHGRRLRGASPRRVDPARLCPT